MTNPSGQDGPATIDKFEEDHAENFRQIERAPLTSLDAIERDELRQFAEWWNSRPQSPPPRSAFDILDHSRLAPFLYVIRCLNDDTYEYVLNGEEVVRMVGRSQARTCFSCEDDDPAMRSLATYFENVVRSRQIWRCAGTLSMYDRGFIQFESLDCPFTDDSGENISPIIGMIFRAKS